jgi:transposase
MQVDCTPKLRHEKWTIVLRKGFMRKTKDGRRLYPLKFKVVAIKRVEKGERPSVVARQLKISEALLSRWRRRFRKSGPAGLGEIGRPLGGKPAIRRDGKKRVAQLERLVGRQQLAIDFLEQALGRVEASSRKKSGSGGTASSK